MVSYTIWKQHRRNLLNYKTIHVQLLSLV